MMIIIAKTTAPETNLWSYSLTFDLFFVCQILYHWPFTSDAFFLLFYSLMFPMIVWMKEDSCAKYRDCGRELCLSSDNTVASFVPCLSKEAESQGDVHVIWLQWMSSTKGKPEWIDCNTQWSRWKLLEWIEDLLLSWRRRGRNRLTPTIL